MFVVGVDSFEDATVTRIFNTIGDWHFANYDEKISLLSRVVIKFVCPFNPLVSISHLKGLAEAMVSVYRQAILVFLPTPTKSHYTFSLRDVTRVFQGIVLMPPKRLTEPEKLARLWAHETYRVFYDRLVIVVLLRQ